MNNYSMTYSQFGCCGNHQISAKYVMDNLVMCENRVNTHTHTHSHRAYSTENILNVKALASRKKKKSLFCYSEARQCFDALKELAKSLSQVLLTVTSDLYLCNTAPPLPVAAVEAWHHHITALSVGIHRALSVTPYFI